VGNFKRLQAKLMLEANQAVWKERQRQNELYGHQRRPWGQWLAILGEEVGEANQAIQPLLGIETTKPTDADDFGKELIHVAAVALAMYEQLHDKDWNEDKKAPYMDLDD
jgi:NTP pyrophosphatase (non-canonical NTP hydrolase)